jgi:hypothetical protein
LHSGVADGGALCACGAEPALTGVWFDLHLDFPVYLVDRPEGHGDAGRNRRCLLSSIASVGTRLPGDDKMLPWQAKSAHDCGGTSIRLGNPGLERNLMLPAQILAQGISCVDAGWVNYEFRWQQERRFEAAMETPVW